MTTTTTPKINGFDVEALTDVVDEVGADPAKGKVAFSVSTAWKGGTRTDATVESYTLAGERVPRRHVIQADEPEGLLGGDRFANPQELLMAGLNACMAVGYVAGASVRGIALSRLEIETSGELDLRGFLGLDATVKPGYDELHYVVRIAGDGTPEQFREIHENVLRTSPNRFNLAHPIRLTSELEIG